MWNRFDICDAYYLIGRDYHGGQWSKEYAILGRLYKLGYKPKQDMKKSDLSKNALHIYYSYIERELM